MLRFTRPLTRRVGDLVVTIGADGITVREFGRRRRVSVDWEWLFERLPWGARTRSEAFRHAAPAGWMPAPGESVWVRAIRGTISSQVSLGQVIRVVPACGEHLFKIRMRHAGHTVDETYCLKNLRPSRK